MKKSISVVLLAIMLLQSCVAYQKTSVSINEACERGSVKVTNSSGKSTRFTNIVLKDSIYYGTNSSNRFIEEPLYPINIRGIFLKDLKKSKEQSIVFGVVLGVPILIIGVTLIDIAINGF